MFKKMHNSEILAVSQKVLVQRAWGFEKCCQWQVWVIVINDKVWENQPIH